MNPLDQSFATPRTLTPSPAPAQRRNTNLDHNGRPITSQRCDKTQLKRVLPGWQILMIAIGGVIGITIFSTAGEIIHTAGPLGLLIATVYVSVTTICVMECMAELVVMWPVSNAMIEFVKMFVDRDFAVVVGIAYWYTMSSVFAVLIVIASDFASFWLNDGTWLAILFYVIVPLGLIGINFFGVKVYGWIEGIGGIVKILLVLAGILFAVVDAVKVGNSNFDRGFQHNPDEAKNSAIAVCICIPILAFGFIGTEIVTVTAFEARDRESLRFPVRWVAYIISALYFASAILQMVIVNFKDCDLQDLNNYDPKCASTKTTRRSIENSYLLPQGNSTSIDWTSGMIIAALDYGSQPLALFFNISIIYFCLSAANTALYVSSRTLFGLTRGINRMTRVPWYLKPFRYFGTATPRVGVPHFALVVSALAFFWLPFLRLKFHYTASDVFIIMSTIGSIGCMVVWFSQCLAYLRYYHWFHELKRRGILPDEYNRWDPQPEKYGWHRHRTLLSSFRTIPAWIGLISCFLIVFVFSSATFWNGDFNAAKSDTSKDVFSKVATAYLGPAILLLIFVILKVWKRRGWVRLAPTRAALDDVTNHFESNSGIPLIQLVPHEMVVIDK